MVGEPVILKLRNRIFHASKGVLGCGKVAVWLSLLVVGQVALGQSVFAPRQELSIAPPALQQYQTNEMEVFAPPGRAASGDELSQPFRWGPVTLRPHLLYRFIYGDGIQASTNQSVSTAIHEFAM